MQTPHKTRNSITYTRLLYVTHNLESFLGYRKNALIRQVDQRFHRNKFASNPRGCAGLTKHKFVLYLRRARNNPAPTLKFWGGGEMHFENHLILLSIHSTGGQVVSPRQNTRNTQISVTTSPPRPNPKSIRTYQRFSCRATSHRPGETPNPLTNY